MKEEIREWLAPVFMVLASIFALGFLIGGAVSLEHGKCKISRIAQFMPSYVAGCYLFANFTWDMEIGQGYPEKHQRSHKKKHKK